MKKLFIPFFMAFALCLFLTSTACSSDDGIGLVDNNNATDQNVDKDGNGLIEIYTIEDLNNIRKDLAGLRNNLQGITSEDFKGYELMNDLDFKMAGSYASGEVNDSYTTGEGWEPIGNSTNPFSATLKGRGYTISNLFINRPSSDHIGLFGYTTEASIDSIGLKEVNVKGGSEVGGLVGNNREGSSINYSYVTGSVMAGGDYVGGLVGGNEKSSINHSYATASVTGNIYVGGLVGSNFNSYINYNYATGNVTGDTYVGGLVGFNNSSSSSSSTYFLSHSYATGSITGDKYVGGLVGSNSYFSFSSSFTIKYSYATGSVMGSSHFGGLVGGSSSTSLTSTITDSYWDTQTSGQQSSAGVAMSVGKTTSELQIPTSYTGIYENWAADDPWDFGSDSQYPVLKNMPNGISAQR